MEDKTNEKTSKFGDRLALKVWFSLLPGSWVYKWKRHALQCAERGRIKNIWVSVRAEMAFQNPLISMGSSPANVLPFNKSSQPCACFCCSLMCWLNAVPEIDFVDWYLICVHGNWKQPWQQASSVGVSVRTETRMLESFSEMEHPDWPETMGWRGGRGEPIESHRDRKAGKEERGNGGMCPQ